jgi:hypothetical protein
VHPIELGILAAKGIPLAVFAIDPSIPAAHALLAASPRRPEPKYLMVVAGRDVGDDFAFFVGCTSNSLQRSVISSIIRALSPARSFITRG